MKGTVFKIEEMTFHDGDGVRVTVFMKGCPLKCVWCHNPEGLEKRPQLLYKRARCKGCGLCLKGCDHTDCKPFGRCLHVCPNDCLSVCGEEYDAETLAKKLLSYKRTFDACGGGVTFSGGEPLLQWAFLSETLDLLKGAHIAIETSGFASEPVFREMLEKIDYVYMDVKIADDELHKKYTGVGNSSILRNFRILKESGKPFTVRTPLISGITDGAENLQKIKELIGDAPWEKLPENKLAKAKYQMLVE